MIGSTTISDDVWVSAGAMVLECVAINDRDAGAIFMHSGEPDRMDVNVPSATDRHTRVTKFRAISVAPPESNLKVRIKRDTFDEGGKFNRSGVRPWFQGSKAVV